jgi:threonine dehydrogenase-like Zn-dependent dehydrogenase
MYGHRDAGFFGYSHFTGGFPGGQAEYVRVPKGNVNLLPIPDDVPDEKALYLSDVLPTSYHAVVDTGVHEGDVVGIWGLGPIGMYAARWAQIKGAKRIIGIDRIPERLAIAREKLGIEVIDFSVTKDVPTEIAKLVPGGLDVALDCGTFHQPKTMLHKVQKALMLETDVPEIVNECILATRKMGRIGIIAAYAGFTNNFNIGAVMEKGIRFIGNGQAPVHLYWEEILNDYLRTGKFDPTLCVAAPPARTCARVLTRPAASSRTVSRSTRCRSCTRRSTSATAVSRRSSSRRASRAHRRRACPRFPRSRTGRSTSLRERQWLNNNLCVRSSVDACTFL